jgi:hypothetical protein
MKGDGGCGPHLHKTILPAPPAIRELQFPILARLRPSAPSVIRHLPPFPPFAPVLRPPSPLRAICRLPSAIRHSRKLLRPYPRLRESRRPAQVQVSPVHLLGHHRANHGLNLTPMKNGRTSPYPQPDLWPPPLIFQGRNCRTVFTGYALGFCGKLAGQ